MIKKALLLPLLLLAFPVAAADLDYNYIQLGYAQVDFDNDFDIGFDLDGDAFGLEGSFEINDDWFISVEYSSIDLNFGIDLDQYSLGAGWHTSLTERADFFAILSYVNAEASAGGLGSVDEDGIGVEIGVRGLVGDKFELGGFLGYVDLGDAGDGATVGGHALYHFTDAVGVGATLEFDEDVTAYGIGVRIYFGR